MKKHYIYGLFEPDTNIVRYVGKTSDLKKRLKEHCRPHTLKDQPDLYFWIKDLKKSGRKPQIKVLEECTHEMRPEIEAFYITYLKAFGCDLFNRVGFSGKTTWNKGRRHSDEQIKKLKEAWVKRNERNEPGPNTGNKHTAATRAKMSVKNKGRVSNRKGAKLSDETKNKLRMAHSRRKAMKNVNKNTDRTI